MPLYRNNSRRNRKNTRRTNRKNSRRANRSRRNTINMMGGEYSMPAPVNDNSIEGPRSMSLAQGQQFGDFHKNQHGGGLVGGPFPGAVTDESLIPADMAAAARTAPLNAALNEIRGMSDQAGGKRRKSRRNRKNSRRNRKNTRKNTRRNRKNTRRNRKNSRRANRKNSMRRRRNMRGGAVFSPASVSAPGLLLPAGLEAKAVSGMNAEWKLAENPRAFAPGL